MEYDIHSSKWALLPLYRACDFAMAAIEDHLVLVGGEQSEQKTSLLGVWAADNRKWTHPYPEIPTPRSRCSAIVHDLWLIVAGGWSASGGLLSSVEVLNINTKTWMKGPSIPIPWALMKTAVVSDVCYFLGGLTEEDYRYTTRVYSMSLSALLTHLEPGNSNGDGHGELWKEVPRLLTILSAPVSISGSLLALGGSKDGVESNAIHLYQHDVGGWVEIGNLLTPRYGFSAALIAPDQLMLVGGCRKDHMKRVDVARLQQKGTNSFNNCHSAQIEGYIEVCAIIFGLHLGC